MTRVTIKTPAIRGIISLVASDANPRLFLAVGSSYKPMEFEAETLGSAVDVFLSNIHRLQRSDESIAKSKARGIKIAASHLANKQAATRQRSRSHRIEQPSTTETVNP